MTFYERAKQAVQDELNPEAKRQAEKEAKAELRERDANPEQRFEKHFSEASFERSARPLS